MSDNPCSVEMPRYRSHKTVWALKIARVEPHTDAGEVTIHPEEDRYAPFRVHVEYVTKHQPKAGGYFVVYEDGYRSWSPAEAFEQGYTRI